MDTSHEPKAAETLYGARDGSAASAGKRSHCWPILAREHAIERTPSLVREQAVDWTHETADGRREERSPELDVIDGHPTDVDLRARAADTATDEAEGVDRPEGPDHFEAADQPEDVQQLDDPEDEQSEDPEDELFLLGERCAGPTCRPTPSTIRP